MCLGTEAQCCILRGWCLIIFIWNIQYLLDSENTSISKSFISVSAQEKQFSKYFQEIRKHGKQMNWMGLVVVFSSQRLSLCSFCDLTIGVFIGKEIHFYLLLPSPLQYILTYISTYILAIQVWGDTLGIGEHWAPGPSLSDLEFWKETSLLNLGYWLSFLLKLFHSS